MTTRPCLFFPAIALALPASLAAQQSPQDFNLPPNPSPTPPVEGPADDSGPVPIGPRPIPTPTPTPLPTRAPQPLPQPTSTPTPTPSAIPRATPAAQPTLAPRATPTPTPGPASAAPGVTPDSGPSALDSVPAFTPPAAATSEPDVASESASAAQPLLPDWWPWAAGLLGALVAGILGGWWMARRRAARPAPTIEAPLVHTGDDDQASSPPAHIATTFEIERLTRSMMALTLKYRLTIANRSDRALRDLSVHADLVSARRHLPMEQQLASGATRLPASSAIERVGPHQSTIVSGELRLALSDVEMFQQGQVPLCVPLARLRIEGTGIASHLRNFLVGLGTGIVGGKVHPLPLNGPPGGYEGAQVRPLD